MNMLISCTAGVNDLTQISIGIASVHLGHINEAVMAHEILIKRLKNHNDLI